jgi:hypothetical protein
MKYHLCTESPKPQGLRWMTLLGLGLMLVKTSTFTEMHKLEQREQSGFTLIV